MDYSHLNGLYTLNGHSPVKNTEYNGHDVVDVVLQPESGSEFHVWTPDDTAVALLGPGGYEPGDKVHVTFRPADGAISGIKPHLDQECQHC